MGELQTSLDGFFKKSPAIQTFSEEEYVDKRKANIFSYLTDICFEKTGTIPEEYDFEMKGWSSFMVLRYLSLYEPYLPIINIFNYYQGTLTPLQLYKALLVVIPKGKRFLKYHILQEELNNDSIIEMLMKYFDCSKSDAEEYIKLGLISQKEVNTIKEKFGGRDGQKKESKKR